MQDTIKEYRAARKTFTSGDSGRKGPLVSPAVGQVLPLPAGRHSLFTDLRSINNQCFQMVSDMHRAILTKLLIVPRKLVHTAQNVLKSGNAQCDPELWSETLSLYLQTLSDAKEQIAAAGKLHGAAQEARIAIESVASLEATLPDFLSSARDPLGSGGRLLASARKLGEAAGALDTALAEILCAVERTAARARSLDRPAQTPAAK